MNDALQEQMNCSRCAGSGYEPQDAHGAYWLPCKSCGGSGLSRVEHMRREQEQRAQRYLGEAPDTRTADACEGVIAWLIVVLMVAAICVVIFTVIQTARWLSTPVAQQ